ncbi:MBL fold metallo-hydrolase [Vibrio salinus]|uniref:MBL fold metallo-hydrolase n=1 Tax=Vibrio salinus TaxID=2899784 RepID=UPI001E331892|nr:ribonuclease Z [Vibrio salinus]MCE0494866.1 ribonuclease Z [Vibrio salinus]
MKIEVIGCGSAFSKQNNTSSVLISDYHNNQWLIDCGPTIPRALWKNKTDINSIQVIYFTHIHPDHCAGLPALLNQWKSFKRTQPLDIFCQQEQKEPLQSLLQLANWPDDSLCFDVRWHPITDHFHWKTWEIKTATTQHEVTNRALRIQADSQCLFYSGDGRPTPMTKALMIGADLAFQECACADPLPEESSHGDFYSCQTLIEETGVSALGLYHCFDETIEDIHQRANTAPGLFLSRDGLIIDLADKHQLESLTQCQK